MKKIAEKFEERQDVPNVIIRKEIFDDKGVKFTRITHYRRWYIESSASGEDRVH